MRSPAVMAVSIVAVSLALTALLLWTSEDPAPSGSTQGNGGESAAAVEEPDPVRRERVASEAPTGPTSDTNRHGRAYVPRVGQATLVGRMVDDFGQPQDDASVEVVSSGVRRGSSRRAVAESRTGADGRFRFEGLEPDETYLVWGKKEGLLPVSSEPVTPSAEETLDLGDLKLTTHCTVSGKVVDPAGRPILGAKVIRMFPLAHPGVLTDEQGRFTLGGLPPGKQTIGAEAAGFIGKQEGSFARMRREPIVLRRAEHQEGLRFVLHPAGVIRGSIIGLDSAPLVEELFKISARASSIRFTGTRATASTTNGSFELKGLDPELSYELVAEGLSGRSLVKKDVRCGGEPVTFVLEAWPAVQVVVRSATDGTPLQVGSIGLFRDGEIVFQHFNWSPEPLADPPAPFMLPYREAGNYKFSVVVKGFESFHSDLLQLDGQASHGPVVALLQEKTPKVTQPAMTGIVLRADSREPLPGVKVLRKAMSQPVGGLGKLHGVLVDGLSNASGGPTMWTDEAGRFSFESGFTPAALLLKDTRFSSSRLDLTRGSPTLNLELLAYENGAVEGRVLLVNGSVGAGFPIVAQRPNTAPRTTRTDAFGRYRIAPLLPGAWRLSVGNPHAIETRRFPERYQDQASSGAHDVVALVTVLEGRIVTADINLEMLAAALEGQVTANGRPQKKVSVTLMHAGADPKNPLLLRIARTGTDGVYGFPAVLPGRYLVSVRSRAGNALLAEKTLSLSRGQALRQDFEVQLGALDVTVLEQESGAPLPNVQVSAQRVLQTGKQVARRPAISLRTDAKGHVLLEGLAAAEYSVVLRTPRGVLGRVTRLPPGAELSLTVLVPRPATLQINIQNSDATHSEKITVHFWSGSQKLFDHTIQHPLTNASAALKNIQPGRYEVRATSSPGGEFATGTIEVLPGGVNTLSLTLVTVDAEDP